jgi:hypothetical protein
MNNNGTRKGVGQVGVRLAYFNYNNNLVKNA